MLVNHNSVCLLYRDNLHAQLISTTRDVTNFVFAFDNMRILTTFQLFDIRRIVARTSVECEYFILCNLTEFS